MQDSCLSWPNSILVLWYDGESELCLISDETTCKHFSMSNIEWGPEIGKGHFGFVHRLILILFTFITTQFFNGSIVNRASLIDSSARWDVAVKGATEDGKKGSLIKLRKIKNNNFYF